MHRPDRTKSIDGTTKGFSLGGIFERMGDGSPSHTQTDGSGTESSGINHLGDGRPARTASLEVLIR